MKWILFLASFFLISQDAISQPIPKRANTIVVNDVAYSALVDSLLERNFTINHSDAAFKTVVTNPKTIKGMSIVLSARIKDSNLIITGQVNFNVGVVISGISIDSSFEEITYKGSYRKAFEVLNDFALSFNKPIQYLVK